MGKYALRYFTYKGAVGANSDLKSGEFLNDIKAPGQLGVIAKFENVGMPKEVKEIFLNRHKREGGSFATTMINKGSMGSLGFGKHLLAKTEKELIEISRDCDLSLLDECVVVDNEVPEDFKKFIDGLSNESL